LELYFFAGFLGYALTTVGEKGLPLSNLITVMNEIIMIIVNKFIWVSPIGVFSLIAKNLGSSGDIISVLKGLGMLIVCRFVGILFHGIVILPLFYFVTTRKNPFSYLKNCSEAFLIAFGSSSSAATLPITIKNSEEKNKLDPRVARFILSTGATINMDAAAIAYTSTAIFLCQVLNIELNFGKMIIVIIASTLVSMGAAAIPSPGLVNYMAVMSSTNIDVEIGVSILAPILSVDFLEDRLMTMVNIESDMVIAGFLNYYYQKKTR